MNILFLCVANSARSQIAEGLAKQIFPPEFSIYSAGSLPGSRVNPFAIEVLLEIGIDITKNSPKPILDIDMDSIDLIVTLCAEELCPVLPTKTKHLHWPMHDPGAPSNGPAKQLDVFRKIRDELQLKLLELMSNSFRGDRANSKGKTSD